MYLIPDSGNMILKEVVTGFSGVQHMGGICIFGLRQGRLLPGSYQHSHSTWAGTESPINIG
jgi:hypothetical protein